MTGNVGISGGWASGVADCTRHAEPVFPMPENPYPMKIPVFLWTEAVERGHEMNGLDGVSCGNMAGREPGMDGEKAFQKDDEPEEMHLSSDIK